MPEQSYETHRKWVPIYHFVLPLAILAGLGGALVNLYHADEHTRYSAALLALVFLCLVPIFYFVRSFALRAQDRAIRAEENLRHYVLTGSLLDSRLDTRQIVGLRFAADDEFVDLAQRAVQEGLSEEAIKKSIEHWRPDVYRA